MTEESKKSKAKTKTKRKRKTTTKKKTTKKKEVEVVAVEKIKLPEPTVLEKPKAPTSQKPKSNLRPHEVVQKIKELEERVAKLEKQDIDK